MKVPNTRMMGVPEEEDKKEGREKILKEIKKIVDFMTWVTLKLKNKNF